MKSYKLSVRLMTYNHGSYIEDALKGIDIQKTNFSFEVVVGDDFSTDDTLSKIRDYNFTNPNLCLRILKRKIGDAYYKERKKRGRLYNFADILNSCKGDFIALLDGDDYWTDPFKLQKQVEFLEKNEEYGICFHNVIQISSFNSLEYNIPNVKESQIFNLKDYILSNRTCTCSILFKKEFLGEIPTWFTELPFGDLGLIIIVMNNSNQKGMVLSDAMGVYRIHEGGIHGSFHQNTKGLIKAYRQHLSFLRIITVKLITQKKFQGVIKRKKLETYQILAGLYFKNGMYLSALRANILYRYYDQSSNSTF